MIQGGGLSSFYPGWTATVDGEPREIQRVNFLFRAVRLEAGRHRVTFSYEPASFELGAAITSSGLLAVAVTGGLGWYRQRSRRGANGRA